MSTSENHILQIFARHKLNIESGEFGQIAKMATPLEWLGLESCMGADQGSGFIAHNIVLTFAQSVYLIGVLATLESQLSTSDQNDVGVKENHCASF